MADTAKDFLRQRIERFKQDEEMNKRGAKQLREEAEAFDSRAAECRKAIADFEAALVKLGGK